MSDDEKLAAKAAVFAGMRADNEQQRKALGRPTAFDRWFEAGANNAAIAAVGLYADRVPQFKAILAEEGGDLSHFYARVKLLAALPKADREVAVAKATER